MGGPIAQERADALARQLALVFAHRRTNGNVYMNGSHNPLPTEVTEAKRFLEMVQTVVGMTPEEFVAAETAMGYPSMALATGAEEPVGKSHDCVLAIVGSRDLPAYSTESKIREVLLDHKPKMVVSGGARGVDSQARIIAIASGIQFMEFLPQHPAFHAPATGEAIESIRADGVMEVIVPGGFQARNEAVADACTCLVRIASPTTKTYGSGWTADYAEKIGKNVERFVVGQ
jgi:hypothetical protein